MLLLATTSSKIQVITGTAVANTQMYAAWIDNASGTISGGSQNTSISTAATTDLVGVPGASTLRNVQKLSVKNTNASTANTITIQHTDGTTVVELWKGVLTGGWSVQMDEMGNFTVFTSGGWPITPVSIGQLRNWSVAAQGAGFATDTYVTGSNILIPSGYPLVGTRYRCRISVSKTAAGTATPIIQIRIGIAGAVGDTSRCSFTFSAGTAATDVGEFDVSGLFRTVGSGTSAVLQGHCGLTSQATTGFSSLLKGVQTTSGGFDSTVANSFIGVSVNGGASAAWTVQRVEAELEI